MSARVSRPAAVLAWIVAGVIFGCAAAAFVAGILRLRVSAPVHARFAADPSCRVPAPVSPSYPGACRLVAGRIVGPVDRLPVGRNCPCVFATIAVPDGRRERILFHRRIAVSVGRGTAPAVLLFENRIAGYYSRDDVEPSNDDPEMVETSDLGLTVWGGLMMMVFGLPIAARYATARRHRNRGRR